MGSPIDILNLVWFSHSPHALFDIFTLQKCIYFFQGEDNKENTSEGPSSSGCEGPAGDTGDMFADKVQIDVSDKEPEQMDFVVIQFE